MKRAMILTSATLLLASVGQAATTGNGRGIREDGAALEIVQRLIQAHGGMERWEATPTCSYTHKMVAPGYEDDPWVSEEIVEQGSRRCFQNWPLDEAQVAFDGETVWSMNWQRGNPPKFMVNLAYYFLNLPWLTQDPGVFLVDSGMGRFPTAEKDYLTVRMTFDEEVGDTPDDYYVLFIDPDTHRMAATEYVVSFGPMLDLFQAPADAKFIGPFFHVYRKWETVAGLTVPSEYDTFLPDGSKMGVHEVTDWSFDQPFDSARLEMPDGAVVDTSDPRRRSMPN